MARYPQGQPIRLSTTVRDVTGALVSAGGRPRRAAYSAPWG
jgi:hypothetical protein